MHTTVYECLRFPEIKVTGPLLLVQLLCDDMNIGIQAYTLFKEDRLYYHQ